MIKRPTIAELKEALSYDAMLGVVWQHRPRQHFLSDHDWFAWNTRFAGEKTQIGQIKLTIAGQYFLLQGTHVIWALKHDKWPENEIDHKDGNPSNNDLENLREATDVEQCQNRRLRSDNSSGFMGVNKMGDKWQARISLAGHRYFLGNFDTAEAAYEAYLKAKEKLHEFQPKPRTASGP